MLFQICVILLIAKNTLGSSHFSNPPTLNSTFGKGTVVDNLGGIKAYITGSFESPKPTILLISDVFGYEAPNLRALADKIADFGFFVVVPDFFYGDPLNDTSQLSTWIKKHGTEKGFLDAKAVLQDLKEKGSCAIGAAGFCWGGKVVAELAKSYDLKAAELVHPAYVTVDDIKDAKIPIEILAAELDQITPPKLIKQFVEVLSTKPEVPSFVKIFPGVDHSWTVRYNVSDKEAVKEAQEAHKYMIHWFKKYVK